ncbi:hypothetical protein DFH11DRAFT_1843284 [Phellopilus nigrolimitatus]|nr:hypothetical protein DFH11DRAFT_1843284 [Phellopilus nigrolimitatus]
MFLLSNVVLTAFCSALLIPQAEARRAIEQRTSSIEAQTDQYHNLSSKADQIKGAMLASIRTSWEQGTAAGAILELDNPEYSVFADSPFVNNGETPVDALRLALSAAARQTSDGRLSQNISDGLDGAALDGASSGSVTLLGKADYWRNATDRQLNFLLNGVPKTTAGAISMRIDSKQYWDDGVYMMPPFLAAYGAVTYNQTLIQMAITDEGVWATGNAWAALGMIRVWSTILKTPYAWSMQVQTNDLRLWVKEILDGTFAAINNDNLIPDYIQGGATFGDASSSAALASVAYRAAVMDSNTFGGNYTDAASRLANAVLSSVDDLGVISPYVNPLSWQEIGILSTEGQAFALMLLSAWRDWLKAVNPDFQS